MANLNPRSVLSIYLMRNPCSNIIYEILQLSFPVQVKNLTCPVTFLYYRIEVDISYFLVYNMSRYIMLYIRRGIENLV